MTDPKDTKASLDSKDIFSNAIKVKAEAEKEGQQRKQTFNSIYHAAVTELGYTDMQLRNNTDAMKEVAKLMFSDKYAGNSQYNTMLAESPFYKGFNEADNERKQELHRLALGIDYNTLLSQIEAGELDRLDDEAAFSIASNVSRSTVRNRVNSYINNQTPGDLFERKRILGEIASQDPLIQGVSDKLDIGDLQNLVYGGVSGDYRRNDLESRVGVSTPKYDFQRAA